MTPELKAAIARIFELSERIAFIEGHVCHTDSLVQQLHQQGQDNARLMAHLKLTTDHVLRLVRQKEVLMEAIVGRVPAERYEDRAQRIQSRPVPFDGTLPDDHPGLRADEPLPQTSPQWWAV